MVYMQTSHKYHIILLPVTDRLCRRIKYLHVFLPWTCYKGYSDRKNYEYCADQVKNRAEGIFRKGLLDEKKENMYDVENSEYLFQRKVTPILCDFIACIP